MTDRAVRERCGGLAGQVQPGRRPPQHGSRGAPTAPACAAAVPVDFAHTSGLSATTGCEHPNNRARNSARTPADYRDTVSRRDPHPGRSRQRGAARPADRGEPARRRRRHHHDRPRRPAARSPVTVAGVVDLPAGESLFQTVGAPPARSRPHRRTTSCCCPPRSGTSCSTRSPRPARIWSRPRSTSSADHRPAAPTPAPPTPR